MGDAGRRTTTSERDDETVGTTVMGRTVIVAALLVTVAGAAVSGNGGQRAAASPPTPAAPLYGVTIDRLAGIDSVVAAERSLPERPITRVYFAASEPASYYGSAVPLLHSVGQVMGELLDSSDAAGISTSAFQSRVESYLHVLGSSVDLWEVGNEVNGNWTGPYAAGAAKLTEAYDDVAGTGGRTALTLYANEYGPDHCGDGTAELTPVQYSERYVPSAVRHGLTDVFESYYPTQCGDTYPTDARVGAELRRLHSLYPDAHLGFGEVGLPHAVTRRTLATGQSVMDWAYGLDPGLPCYVGGYFWWYASEDVFTGRALLAGSLPGAFEAEATALR